MRTIARLSKLSWCGFVLLASVTSVSALAEAQEGSPPVPQIVTTGVGEATVVPDRALVTFAVDTRAPSAAAAGAENARVQSAVIAALRKQGVLPAHLTTSGYSVSANERYDNGQRRVVGYIARNAVIVDVQEVTSVGTLIDAALGAGANSVGGVRYYSTRIDVIRRTALESAVAHARADAEAMARAAGGSLGGPLEISQQSDVGFARTAMLDQVMVTGAAEGVPTPVVVGEQKVTVRVNTRWHFVSGR